MSRPSLRSRSSSAVRVAIGAVVALALAAPGVQAATTSSARLTVSSPVMTDGGTLPERFTCDGASVSPPIRWKGAPKGTRSYAVVMHHEAGPGDLHTYLLVHTIPSTIDHLDEGSTKVGRFGVNTVDRKPAYTPPCSKGPGPKPYTLTVYALSKAPTFASGTLVTREALLAAITKTTLASASMTVTYSRPASVVGAAPNSGGQGGKGGQGGQRGVGAGPASTASTASADSGMVTGWIYADNWFELSVNGVVVATDPTPFKPFDVVPVRFPAVYPMTIAIIAKDYADPTTGLEYDNTKVGDGGLIARFSNGVVTDGRWHTLVVSRGPLDLPTCLADPRTCKVENTPVPDGWTRGGFDDSRWPAATVFTREQVQPHADDYDRYDWGTASFVWGRDLVLDNTVLFRTTIPHA